MGIDSAMGQGRTGLRWAKKEAHRRFLIGTHYKGMILSVSIRSVVKN